jgi:hypothetical protein
MPRKTRPAPAASAPVRHFEKYLAGETAPAHETMRRLYALAGEFHALHPWDFLLEDHLVVVEAPQTGGLGFCSLMGALHEVFSFHVYLGADGYHFFRKVHAGEPFTIGDFFAGQHAVNVEFVPSAELTAADRQLLKALGHPFGKGFRAPKFRSMRPGYHPWYVTEQEALILTTCLDSFLGFFHFLEAHPGASYWEKEGDYPLVSRRSEGDGQAAYAVRPIKAPAETVKLPRLPDLDETRIRRIREARLPSRGAVDVDHFYGAGMVGESHERKACIRVAIAIDSETAFAFPPEVGSPEASTGDLLAEVVLTAVESSRALPSELRVKSREYKSVLGPLAKALGTPVKIVKSLPAADFARDQLLRMMGDPGAINAARPHE